MKRAYAKGPFVVLIPTPMGGAFAMDRGLSSEYPNARKFETLDEARDKANGYEGAQVYTVDGYESGSGPVHL